jgi:peptide/nickel transport system substrate-binding protein
MAGSADHSNLENPNVFIETLKRQAEPDAHFDVVWGPELLAFGLSMNLSDSLGVEDERDAELRKLFRDQRFRRAVSQAIDREGVAQAVVRGPFLRPFPGGLLPGATEYDRRSVVYYPYSPETSRKLLAEIGLEDTDGDGIVNWTEGPMAGENLVIELNAGEDAEATVDIGEALVPLMADVGIQLNFRPMKGTAMTDDNIAGTWEWHMWRSGQNLAVPYSRVEELGPTTKEWGIHREGDQPRNLLPFEEELVRIINEFAAEPNDAQRKELMFEFNRIWTENVYRVGIVVGSYGLALAKRFQNIPIGCPTFLYHWTWGNAAPEQVWVQPEEQIEQIRPGVVPLYAPGYLE